MSVPSRADPEKDANVDTDLEVAGVGADFEPNTDADDQDQPKFPRYVDLPSELRIKVIQEFIASLRKQRSGPYFRRLARLASFEAAISSSRFAPFTVVHSEWQHLVEAQQELFGNLSLFAEDLPAFHQMSNQRRCNSLTRIFLKIVIKNTVINPNGVVEDDMSDANIITRAGEYIVSSVARVLETVAEATLMNPQAKAAQLELRTHIALPFDAEHARLTETFSLANGIDCDFSQLQLAHGVSAFAQRDFVSIRHWVNMRGDRTLLLSLSSLLTLFGRMPNLEQVNAVLPVDASINLSSTQPPGIFEHLKKLEIKSLRQWSATASQPQSLALTAWTSSRTDKIENLELCCSSLIADVLGALCNPGHETGTKAWPSLRVLKLCGFYKPPRSQTLDRERDDDPTDALWGIAAALPSLPRLEVIQFSTRRAQRTEDFFGAAVELRLCGGSSRLKVSRQKYDASKLGLRTRRSKSSCMTPSNKPLSVKTRLLAAAAGVQAAVWEHYGLNLKIVWPKECKMHEST